MGRVGLLPRAASNPRKVVHNEEHGGVVIWWGPKVPPATIDQLRRSTARARTAMFGTPYAKLGNKIALTAWTGDPAKYYRNGYYGMGHIAICPKFDETAFKAFRDAYRGKGPEGIPESSNTPGSGPSRSGRPRQPPGNSPSVTFDRGRAAALAHELDLHRLARLVPGEHGAELVGGRRRLAVDGGDHVAGLDPGLGGRASRR